MTNPYATGTSTRPGGEHPAPSAPPRAVPRRAWLTGLVVAAALTVAIAVGDDAPASVVVDGHDPVQLDGAIVTTPCFSYRVPDGLELDRRSAGCATVVGFGHDYLTQITVAAQAGGVPRLDEAVARLRQSMIAAGASDVEVDTLTIRGREAVRIRNIDSWGVPRTSYLVSLPAGRFTQAGRDLDQLLLTSPASPEFDGWMATVVESLEIPGD